MYALAVRPSTSPHKANLDWPVLAPKFFTFHLFQSFSHSAIQPFIQLPYPASRIRRTERTANVVADNTTPSSSSSSIIHHPPACCRRRNQEHRSTASLVPGPARLSSAPIRKTRRPATGSTTPYQVPGTRFYRLSFGTHPART